ncbi:MAG: hypothetical protein JXR94_10895, partial [Candidatus Hydrogenedentes bacterium]|nr:hypothetical protein [Candidatus Hydrogenedentota bacterium]
ITVPIKLNFAEPAEVATMVENVLTKELGQVAQDVRGRHIIVTDYPVVVEQIRQLVEAIDTPVKQVAIEAMIVDAVLRDASQTGINWLVEAVRHFTRHTEDVFDTDGNLVTGVHPLKGNLDNLSVAGNLGTAIGADALDAGIFTFGLIGRDVNLEASIAGEVASRNAEILANPVVVTVENQPATIAIVQDYPYQELTESTDGGAVASTDFKEIGVTLEVTPRVTHENDIICELSAKQSSVSALTDSGVPIEDKREASTTLRTANGRTFFIGGLRNVSDRLEVSKIPVLGDVPVLNFVFRSTDTEKVNTELLIFLTCNVLGEHLPELTAAQQQKYDKLDGLPKVPDAQRSMFRAIVKPQEMRDPVWKWRRPE